MVIEVTPEGEALAPRLAPVFGRTVSRLPAGFAEPELRQLTGMLHRMLDNLRESRENPVD
ncbi:hypothetical protein Sme01_04490 [Sphaerisporangium melleum]|uniref:MarR family transcriptional regulator n=1 Tax=Sphaerisporangium melleum TaxID=321316 RepID=A0A917VBU6_9ACTN|nr:hypothetical protein [Sphaerisporangium melleum]GGK62495.1 hypothetical protein GCM10007964_02040 [Sphaerisporangium melleum]GII67973.1 hypothetical protein Sme01_04490 [Sphaerisporangium melleum]